MAFNNLGDLKSAVADWLNREDLVSTIPDFIRMGVDRINRDTRSINRNSLRDVTLTVTEANQQNPYEISGLSRVESLLVDDEVIPLVSYEAYIDLLKKEGKAWTLAPVSTEDTASILYTGFDDVAAGAEDVKLTVRGYATPDFADYVTNSNTFFEYTENPSVYLYAALVEASIYLRDMEGVTLYQARYDELMDKIYRNYKRQQVMGGMAVSSIGADSWLTH